MSGWWNGTDGRIVAMAIPSQGWYGVPKGLIYSFPVRVVDGAVQVVEGLDLNDHTKARIQANVDALTEEREAVKDLL